MLSIRVLLVAVLALVVAQSLQDFEDMSADILTHDNKDMYEPVHGDRHRRVTCDLLNLNTSVGPLNQIACAAHCLAMMKGYRGGRCIDGVCHCRR